MVRMAIIYYLCTFLSDSDLAAVPIPMFMAIFGLIMWKNAPKLWKKAGSDVTSGMRLDPQAASHDDFSPYKHDASGSYSSFKARVGLSGHGSKAPTSRGRTVSLHTVPYARLLPRQLLKQKLIIQSPLRFPKTVVPTVLCLYLYSINHLC